MIKKNKILIHFARCSLWHRWTIWLPHNTGVKGNKQKQECQEGDLALELWLEAKLYTMPIWTEERR